MELSPATWFKGKKKEEHTLQAEVPTGRKAKWQEKQRMVKEGQ